MRPPCWPPRPAPPRWPPQRATQACWPPPRARWKHVLQPTLSLPPGWRWRRRGWGGEAAPAVAACLSVTASAPTLPPRAALDALLAVADSPSFPSRVALAALAACRVGEVPPRAAARGLAALGRCSRNAGASPAAALAAAAAPAAADLPPRAAAAALAALARLRVSPAPPALVDAGLAAAAAGLDGGDSHPPPETPAELARLIWALARTAPATPLASGGAGAAAVGAAVSRFARAAETADGRSLALAVWGAARLLPAPESSDSEDSAAPPRCSPALGSLLLAAAARGAGLAPRDAAAVAIAAASARGTPPDGVLAALAERGADAAAAAAPRALAGLLWAAETAGAPSARLLAAAADAAVARASDFSPRDAADTLWAIARAADPSRRARLAARRAAAAGASPSSDPSGFGGTLTADAADAAAVAAGPAGRAAAAALAARAARGVARGERWTPRDAAAASWALTSLGGGTHADTVAALAAAAAPTAFRSGGARAAPPLASVDGDGGVAPLPRPARGAAGRDVSAMLSALAAAATPGRRLPPADVDALTAAVAAAAPGVPPSSAPRVLASLASLARYPGPDVVDTLAAAGAAGLAEGGGPPAAAAALAGALARLRHAPAPSVAAAIADHASSRAPDYSVRDWTALAAAYGRAGAGLPAGVAGAVAVAVAAAPPEAGLVSTVLWAHALAGAPPACPAAAAAAAALGVVDDDEWRAADLRRLHAALALARAAAEGGGGGAAPLWLTPPPALAAAAAAAWTARPDGITPSPGRDKCGAALGAALRRAGWAPSHPPRAAARAPDPAPPPLAWLPPPRPGAPALAFDMLAASDVTRNTGAAVGVAVYRSGLSRARGARVAAFASRDWRQLRDGAGRMAAEDAFVQALLREAGWG